MHAAGQRDTSAEESIAEIRHSLSGTLDSRRKPAFQTEGGAERRALACEFSGGTPG
jgi:hypothetical protein